MGCGVYPLDHLVYFSSLEVRGGLSAQREVSLDRDMAAGWAW